MDRGKKVIVFILFSVLMASGCAEKEPVKLGLIADFTGRATSLAIQARNGINMAIDELNESGGINGRTLELIYDDHKGDPQGTPAVVRSLVSQGVDVIIGPMVSGMASYVIEAAAESNTLVIGPTISTDSLTGIDDNFIRGVAPATHQGKYLARSVLSSDLSNIAFIMDYRNRSYTDAVLAGFKSESGERSSIIGGQFYFNDKEDFPSIVRELEALEPDGIVFVASGIDTAGIIQQYALNNTIPRLFSGTWSKVTNVVEYAGRTVEGMIIVDFYNNAVPLERERIFHNRFKALYSVEASVAAISAYESVMLYVEAFRLAGTTDSDRIKETIIGMEEIEGVADTFSIDEFGDGIRPLSMIIIENGEYRLMPEREIE